MTLLRLMQEFLMKDRNFGFFVNKKTFFFSLRFFLAKLNFMSPFDFSISVVHFIIILQLKISFSSSFSLVSLIYYLFIGLLLSCAL